MMIFGMPLAASADSSTITSGGLSTAVYSSISTPSAMTISALQNELQSLLNQLKTLESQSAAPMTGVVSGSASASGAGSVSGSAGSASGSNSGAASASGSVGAGVPPVSWTVASECIAVPVITRTLSLGSSGDDVTALQQFLSTQGYLNASATGYFGALTKAAVSKWQAQNGISAVGVFGPVSRSYISSSCGGSTGGNTGGGETPLQMSQQNYNFTASPLSGAAPLSVGFSATPTDSNQYVIDYGDGSNSGPLQAGTNCASNQLYTNTSTTNCGIQALHTYATPGVYTASFSRYIACMYTNPRCLIALQPLGSATITVSGTSTVPTPPPFSNPPITSIQQVNAPGTVTLTAGGIAEVHNESFYFTLENVTASTATIQPTPVGCWNSFPSDTSVKVYCMIYAQPIPAQTLSVGQSYTTANYSVALTQINDGSATFSVTATQQ